MKKHDHTNKPVEGAEAPDHPRDYAAGQAAAPGETPVASSDGSNAIEAAGGDGAESVEQLRARVAALEEALYRAKADYQNLQRRTALERSEAIRFANADLMRSLLVVVDGLQRSLDAAANSSNLQAVFDGVRLVYDDLMKALGAHGLEPIEAHRKPFDPNVHEALMQQPSADAPAGTVLEEIARGYRLRERVLRPAKVVVAREMEPSTGAPSPA